MPVVFGLVNGRGDPSGRIIEIKRSLHPTDDDLLYAGQRQRSRIIDRTERGVDVNGQPFKPYSKKGPYYYYPNARAGRSLSDRQKKAAAKRLIGKVKSRGGTGARLTRNGNGIRFDSYAAFKQWLGRSGVDLTGPRAPHMMQAIVVKADRDELRLGVYGEKAQIAAAHNEGTKHLPKRRFFAANKEDIATMVRDIYGRIAARLGNR